MPRLPYSIIKYLPVFFFLLACTEKADTPVSEESEESNHSISSFSFETFTQFPEDIDGCSCYFSKDTAEFKEKKYIFLDNFEDIAYVKIESKMIRLTRKKTEEFSDFSVKTTYRNEEFELVIKIYEGDSSGEETWMNSGEITLTKKSGGKIKIPFYGECGC